MDGDEHVQSTDLVQRGVYSRGMSYHEPTCTALMIKIYQEKQIGNVEKHCKTSIISCFAINNDILVKFLDMSQVRIRFNSSLLDSSLLE